MANMTIVREGYAQPFTKSQNVRYAALFRQCGQGRRAGAGVVASRDSQLRATWRREVGDDTSARRRARGGDDGLPVPTEAEGLAHAPGGGAARGDDRELYSAQEVRRQMTARHA